MLLLVLGTFACNKSDDPKPIKPVVDDRPTATITLTKTAANADFEFYLTCPNPGASDCKTIFSWADFPSGKAEFIYRFDTNSYKQVRFDKRKKGTTAWTTTNNYIYANQTYNLE